MDNSFARRALWALFRTTLSEVKSFGAITGRRGMNHAQLEHINVLLRRQRPPAAAQPSTQAPILYATSSALDRAQFLE